MTYTGMYQGRLEPRPGEEDALSPTEKKAIAKAEPIALDLRPDGRFDHRGCLAGTWEVDEAGIRLTPRWFMGKSREEQEETCAERGTQFRFAFVFDPWRARSVAGGLEADEPPSPVRTLYRLV